MQKGDKIGLTWIRKAAIGYDLGREGEIRHRKVNKSGGPINIGDEWLLDAGPYGRNYHYAASYVPNDPFTPPPPRQYCAVAACQGHCGPVMHRGTTTFAWGVFEGFYTLKWRPNPTLPMGGDECPSGLPVVRCWDDEERGVLWAYGVRGEDCHSTCSLAGALPSDLMCNEDAPISTMEDVPEIMTNFENPYNSRDDGDYTCTKGYCWNGESGQQILVHEFNSNCYVPKNTEKYVCDTRIGNANCVGQRFNQVCPCIRGCSWAAGPSCAPSRHPSAAPISDTDPTPAPTDAPITNAPTTNAPTDAPIVGPDCEDSKAWFSRNDKRRRCNFVSKRKENMCERDIFKRFCAKTCEACNVGCDDADLPFYLNRKARKEWTCAEVANLEPELLKKKCEIEKIYTTCRETCDTCGKQHTLINFDENGNGIKRYFRTDLQFVNWFTMDAKNRYPDTGFEYGTISEPLVGFNGHSAPMGISCPNGSFTLHSMYMTPAFYDDLVVTVQARKDGSLKAFLTLTLPSTKQSTYLKSQLSNFTDIDDLVVATSRSQVAVDDMTVEIISPCTVNDSLEEEEDSDGADPVAKPSVFGN